MSEDKKSIKKITIFVKKQNEKKTISIDENATITDLKNIVAKEFNAQPCHLSLIFAGKIMEDHETLGTHNVKDNFTIFLVIKVPQTANKSQTKNSQMTETSSGSHASTSKQDNFLTNVVDSELSNKQQRPESQFQTEAMNNFFENMLMQSFMDNLVGNPEFVRTLASSNPQIQELMKRNPELSHVFNDPQLLRQSLELSRNPAIRQELMRTQDRALSNLESIPGGYNALQRIYRDVLKPISEATENERNPFSTLRENNNNNTNGTPTNPQQGQVNRNPLPNPWNPDEFWITSESSIGLAEEQIEQILPIIAQRQSVPFLHEADEFFEMIKFVQEHESLLTISEQNSTEVQPPEECYKNQLEELTTMGFINYDDNLQALIETFGDIEAAIEILFKKSQ